MGKMLVEGISRRNMKQERCTFLIATEITFPLWESYLVFGVKHVWVT